VVGPSAENVFNIPDDVPENQKITLAREIATDGIALELPSTIENQDIGVPRRDSASTRIRIIDEANIFARLRINNENLFRAFDNRPRMDPVASRRYTATTRRVNVP
jgi:hypothetical protein